MDRARRFGAFLCKPPCPQERGAAELEAFLKHLAVNLHVLATIKNQAKVEIVLFHKRVFGVDLRWLGGLVKANTPQHSLVVMPALPQRPLSLR